MNLSLAEEMELIEADGIDFFTWLPNSMGNIYPIEHIIASFTKEEFTKETAYPKARYKFWKIFNGKKVYMVL